jgi:hypothetical protein
MPETRTDFRTAGQLVNERPAQAKLDTSTFFLALPLQKMRGVVDFWQSTIFGIGIPAY